MVQQPAGGDYARAFLNKQLQVLGRQAGAAREGDDHPVVVDAFNMLIQINRQGAGGGGGLRLGDLIAQHGAAPMDGLRAQSGGGRGGGGGGRGGRGGSRRGGGHHHNLGYEHRGLGDVFYNARLYGAGVDGGLGVVEEVPVPPDDAPHPVIEPSAANYAIGAEEIVIRIVAEGERSRIAYGRHGEGEGIKAAGDLGAGADCIVDRIQDEQQGVPLRGGDDMVKCIAFIENAAGRAGSQIAAHGVAAAFPNP